MNVPELRIYDPEMNFLGVIDVFTSLQWIPRYDTPGSFELHCAITDNTMSLLKRGNLVWKSGDKDAGIIENAKQEITRSKKEITASGRFLSSYLDRRLIKSTFEATNQNLHKVINDLYAACVPIPLVQTTDYSKDTWSEKVSFQATYKSLLSIIQNLCKTTGCGFRIRPDFREKKLYLDVYKGIDRSLSQSDNPRVIFSPEYSNLPEASYSENDQIYSNVCYVGGQGEGADRKIVVVGNDKLSGLERRETFLAATDITPDKLTDAQYEDCLRQRGLEKLAESSVLTDTSCLTDAYGSFDYGRDYEVGDIITIRNDQLGIQQDHRVTEVSQIYERGKYQVEPTFGDANVSSLSSDSAGSGSFTSVSGILDKVYPVGSIYMSMAATNPGDLFGGTWIQLNGRFLLGMGFAGTDNSSDHFGAKTGLSSWQAEKAGETGGQAWHELSVDEMPKHQHDTPFFNNMGSFGNNTDGSNNSDIPAEFGRGMTASEAAKLGLRYPSNQRSQEIWFNGLHNYAEGDEPSYLTSPKGSGVGHNTMPPYIAVYMWQRTK